MENLNFALIGQRIREIRISKHMTQEFLANSVDVNVSHISNIETNKVKVSLSLLVCICNVLNVTVDYILGNEYNAPASAIETELLNTFHSLNNEKQETLLRIAKVL